ncbi:cardiotrophin-2-like isoform X2 [Stegostoma tigrinum]|uniref:cardiotrophin-2-like isoform X2 n=1 Tax=Stegostoma tigrinum TaxID=3053191 RepID=UPI0028705E2F|nr:cardiotrophin-2-like isoform X2 [Stegostoma tigrinum]
MEVIGTHAPRVSTRSRTRYLASIAGKMLKMVQELLHRSQHLVDLYKRQQGPPFNRPGFAMPGLSLRGLPEVPRAEGNQREEAEDDEARLQAEHEAYRGLAHYLRLVLDDQRELNPSGQDLHQELAYFAVNVEGLAVNLGLLLRALGHEGPDGVHLGTGLTGASDWDKKRAGLVVCTRGVQWLRASEGDFSALVSRYN